VSRRWLGRIGLALGGSVIGLLACVGLVEGHARLTAPHGAADMLFGSPDNAPPGLYSTDPELGSVPTPNFGGVQASLGYRVQLDINEHSLRGPALGPKDAPRWLVGGDSFTFAAQVNEPDTFVGRLGAGTDTEFLNAGVDGYSTWEPGIRYTRLDPELDLDGLLVVLFLGNDLTDNQAFPGNQQRYRRMPAGQPLVGAPVPPLRRLLARHSYVYGRWKVQQRLVALQDPGNPDRNRWQSELVAFTTQKGAERLVNPTRRALQALVSLTQKHGDDLMVAVAPPAFQVEAERLAPTLALVGIPAADADVSRPQRVVEKLLQEQGVAHCDLVAPLQAAQAQGVHTYFSYDGHWTTDGHAVVAETLTACLESRGWASRR
jgi:hypothetical protein